MHRNSNSRHLRQSPPRPIIKNMFKKKFTVFFIIVFFIILSSILVFFIGYKMGGRSVVPQVAQEMLDMQRFFIAQRAARVISDLHEIKVSRELDDRLICDVREIVLNKADDWAACKSNYSCNKKTQVGYFLKIDQEIKDFHEIDCSALATSSSKK